MTEASAREIARRQEKLLDTVAISQLIQRERRARDCQDWAELESCYTADPAVEISWFKGTRREFAEASRKMAAGGLLTFHQPGVSVVELNGDRALADTGMAAHVVSNIRFCRSRRDLLLPWSIPGGPPVRGMAAG